MVVPPRVLVRVVFPRVLSSNSSDRWLLLLRLLRDELDAVGVAVGYIRERLSPSMLFFMPRLLSLPEPLDLRADVLLPPPARLLLGLSLLRLSRSLRKVSVSIVLNDASEIPSSWS